MRHRVDEIGFTSPNGLVDATSYTFRATGPREQLEVESEGPAGGATPAALALADVRQQLVDYLGDAFTLVGAGELVLAGKPAKFLHYQIHDRGSDKQGFIVIANLGSEVADGDWVQLSWQLEVPAAAVRTIVDPVLASFTRGSAMAPAKGSNRRQAATWVFELPPRYTGPRSFVWADDEIEQRLSITVHPFDIDKPDLDARVTQIERAGRKVEVRDDVPIIFGQLVRLRLLDEAGERWFACRAAQAYQIGNPVRERWVEVAGEGRLADEAQLRKRIDDLLASIAVEDRR
jgi:hypothetical protein